ncbi:MAG TPA: ATP-binding cassette domain-containing protein, partial [Acidimicrobiales bacterium]|nr:ATP-binding cassette domain-containing protein [Acidimicrobiales bacterium]
MLDDRRVGRLPSQNPTALKEVESGIDVDQVFVDIGDSRILTDVCVSAPQGSSLSVLGPSGCGKTTLLRLLAGLQTINSGTVHLDGERVASDGFSTPPEQRNIGLVFQDWALFPHLT